MHPMMTAVSGKADPPSEQVALGGMFLGLNTVGRNKGGSEDANQNGNPFQSTPKRAGDNQSPAASPTRAGVFCP